MAKKPKVKTEKARNAFKNNNNGGSNTMDEKTMNADLEMLNEIISGDTGSTNEETAEPNYSNDVDDAINDKTAEHKGTASSPKLDEVTKAILSDVNSEIGRLSAETDSAIGYTEAVKAHSNTARIVGYLTKTDSRVDFVKAKVKDTSQYRLYVKNSAPSPVAGVMIASPSDLIQLLKTAKSKQEIKVDDVKSAEQCKTKYLSYVPKNGRQLHTFLLTKCAGYVCEDESLFVPYYKVSASTTSTEAKLTAVEKWEDPGYKKYNLTGGKAGIYATMRSRAKKDTTTKTRYKNISSLEQLDVVAVLANTARPKLGLAPGNYIAESKFDELPVKDIRIQSTKDAEDYTNLYFGRWLNSSNESTKLAPNSGVSGGVHESSIVKFETVDGGVVANCFSQEGKDKFWNDITIDHWYNVDTVNKKFMQISGNDIKLVLRDPHVVTNSSTGQVKTTVKASKLTLGTERFPFVIPEKIERAATKAGVIDNIKPEAIEKCVSTKDSNSNRNSKSVAQTISLLGYSLEEVQAALSASAVNR
jgi:hypothetical protein